MTPISQISPVFNKISTPIHLNQWNTQSKIQKKTKTNLVDLTRKLPWLKSKAIKMAIAELHDLKFDEKDIIHTLRTGLKKMNEKYNAVIKIDYDYNFALFT